MRKRWELPKQMNKREVVWSQSRDPALWDELILSGIGLRFSTYENYAAMKHYITIPHRVRSPRQKPGVPLERGTVVVRGTGSWGHLLPGSGDQ